MIRVLLSRAGTFLCTKARFITYKAGFVTHVVCEFQFMEADNFLHPLLPSGGTVRVDVHPLGHLGVRLASHHPPAREKNYNILKSVIAVTNDPVFSSWSKSQVSPDYKLR